MRDAYSACSESFACSFAKWARSLHLSTRRWRFQNSLNVRRSDALSFLAKLLCSRAGSWEEIQQQLVPASFRLEETYRTWPYRLSFENPSQSAVGNASIDKIARYSDRFQHEVRCRQAVPHAWHDSRLSRCMTMAAIKPIVLLGNQVGRRHAARSSQLAPSKPTHLLL